MQQATAAELPQAIPAVQGSDPVTFLYGAGLGILLQWPRQTEGPDHEVLRLEGVHIL
jgi:hypothetical protein